MALNWLCWARRIRFDSFLLLAEDAHSARIFRALSVPVIVPPNAAEELPPSDYGSVDSAPFLMTGSCVLERRGPAQAASPISSNSASAPVDRDASATRLSPTLLSPHCAIVSCHPSNFTHLSYFTAMPVALHFQPTISSF